MKKIIFTMLLGLLDPQASAEAFKDADFSKIKEDPNHKSIQRGKDLLDHTFKKLPKNVKARINCSNCHLDSGTEVNAAPFIGITFRYPVYYARDNKVESLKERINHCFERSMNGKPLKENSQEMKDMINYMAWLSKPYKKDQKLDGIHIKHMDLGTKPDLAKGKQVYEAKCLACHQADGAGLLSENGEIIFPAIWGNYAFNIGAGMARQFTAAGFVKTKMPYHNGNTLTDEEAWNVAAYFTQQPRPDFKKKELDWPMGDKPKDARY